MKRKDTQGKRNAHQDSNLRELRLLAEERTAPPVNIQSDITTPLNPGEYQHALHELRVQQVELEMQNFELIKADHELEISRERYFELYNLAPVGYLTLNEQGLILEANLTAASLLEVNRNVLVRQPLPKFIFTEDQDIFYLHCKMLSEKVDSLFCELRFIKGNGRLFWAQLQSTRSSWNPPNSLPRSHPFTEHRITFSDISERKQTESDLALQKEHQSALIENTEERIWAVDNNYRLIIGNSLLLKDIRDHVSATFGIGDSILFESLPAEVRHEWRSYYDRAFKGEKFSIQNEVFLGKDTFTREHHFHPIHDQNGEITGAAVSGRDITEQKKMQSQLLEKAANIVALIENTEDSIWAIDNNYLFLSCNSVLEKEVKTWLGRNYVIGENVLLDQNSQKVNELWKAYFDRALSGEKFSIELETNIVNISGCKEFHFHPVTLPNGEIRGVVVSGRDISSRKLAEQELFSSREQLEQLYKHIEEVREEERASISREIHDELGQALTALKIDVCWTRDNSELTSQLSQKFENILSLVNTTIKNVQRIASDLRPSILDDLGLASAIEWYCDEFEKRSGIQCIADLEDIKEVSIQKSLALFRMLQEALTNILRHSGAKNVRIRLYKEKQEIHLEVGDDGIGIPEDKILSLDSLGLMGMRERARQLHGRFNLESNGKEGSLVSMIIPY